MTTMQNSPRRWVNAVWSLKNEDVPYTAPPIPLESYALHHQKSLVMDEFMRLRRQETNTNLKPTASLDGVFLKRELSLIDNPWSCKNQAVRQLANVSRKGPRQRFFPGNNDPQLIGANNRYGLPLKPKLQKQLQQKPANGRKKTVLWAERIVLPDIGSPEREIGISIRDGDEKSEATRLDVVGHKLRINTSAGQSQIYTAEEKGIAD